jgi:uncharacterized membrane protein
MSEWLEHTVQVEVETPIALVWSLWYNLEEMPNWMNWIESVKILPDNPELSRWQLATNNFRFSWLSRITKLIDYQIIQWESVDGLPNKGAIRFYDRQEKTIIKLTVSYAIPKFLAILMENTFIKNAVESSLRKSLERFRLYAIDRYQQGNQ